MYSTGQLVCASQGVLQLPGMLGSMGIQRAALLTGGSSLDRSGWRARIEEAFRDASIACQIHQVKGEPSVELVDDITREAKEFHVQAVTAVGGGSVIDAAKAVSAMVCEPLGVERYLEGVGDRKPSGKRVHFSAVPTTAGTGSESSFNAVISRIGSFKKSLRHEAYTPDIAVLDPQLSLTCPPSVTAASGLDAVTQLLESYVSVRAHPITDALALQGLCLAGSAFDKAVRDEPDEDFRAQMLLAAYLSGITLSNAGLGAVHGVAGVLGGMQDIPHNIVCGTLLFEITAASIRKLESSGYRDGETYRKYARAGCALAGSSDTCTAEDGIPMLLNTLSRWQEQLVRPRLSEYGFTKEKLKRAAAASDCKQAPVILDAGELEAVLLSRL